MDRPQMSAKLMPPSAGGSREGKDHQNGRKGTRYLKGDAPGGKEAQPAPRAGILAPGPMVTAHLAEAQLKPTPLSHVASFALAGVSLIPRKCGHWHKDGH